MSRRDKRCVLFSKVSVVLVSTVEVLKLFSQGEVISVESTMGFLVLHTMGSCDRYLGRQQLHLAI